MDGDYPLVWCCRYPSPGLDCTGLPNKGLSSPTEGSHHLKRVVTDFKNLHVNVKSYSDLTTVFSKQAEDEVVPRSSLIPKYTQNFGVGFFIDSPCIRTPQSTQNIKQQSTCGNVIF